MSDQLTHVNVRPARRSDDAALLRVEKSAWTASSGFPSLREPDATEFFNDHRRRVEIHFVAEVDDDVVGYIRLDAGGARDESAHVLGIVGLAVAPWVRGRGVASALLSYVEEESRRRGAHKIALGVLSTNDQARRLYERHGYVVEGRLRAEFIIEGRYVDDIVMAKFLTEPTDARGES